MAVAAFSLPEQQVGVKQYQASIGSNSFTATIGNSITTYYNNI
jgi:hypothetical protein